MPASEVLAYLNESLFAAIHEKPFRVNSDRFDELSTSEIEVLRLNLPVQRVAPAQFEISEGKLRVRAQPLTPKRDADAIVGQSFEALCQQGEEIRQALEGGNFDQRLLAKVKNVTELLSDRQNVIKLGLQNITCGAISKALAHEIPEALTAQIDGFCAGIAMYIAQFDEWQIFVQNAAEAAINENSTEELRDFADNILREASEFKNVIDPEVPLTIKFLSDLLSEPKRTTKRALFAFVRTIENLLIETFGYLLSLGTDIANKAKDDVADKGGILLSRAIIAITLVSAAGLLPVANQVKGMEWIEATYKVVKEQVAPQLTKF